MPKRVQHSVSDAPEVACRRPSRRVEGTPQSIQDRMPSTVPEMPTTAAFDLPQ